MLYGDYIDIRTCQNLTNKPINVGIKLIYVAKNLRCNCI